MSAAVPLVDMGYLGELRTIIGRDPVDRMVTSFLAEADAAPAAIAGLAGADARAAAHRLRGAALNLGCTAIALVCAEIEAAAPASATSMAQLADVVAGTRSALTAA